jgi:hypothetical protein
MDMVQNGPPKPQSKVLAFSAVNTSVPPVWESEPFSVGPPAALEDGPDEVIEMPAKPEPVDILCLVEAQGSSLSQEEVTAGTVSATGPEEQDDVQVPLASEDKAMGAEPAAAKKPRGRPVRYTNKSKVCRIPVDLEEEIKMMLQIVCPKGGINEKELARFKTALRELCEK